jgi:hypothetical protein
MVWINTSQHLRLSFRNLPGTVYNKITSLELCRMRIQLFHRPSFQNLVWLLVASLFLDLGVDVSRDHQWHEKHASAQEEMVMEQDNYTRRLNALFPSYNQHDIRHGTSQLLITETVARQGSTFVAASVGGICLPSPLAMIAKRPLGIRSHTDIKDGSDGGPSSEDQSPQRAE